MTDAVVLDQAAGWAHRDGIVDLKPFDPVASALLGLEDRLLINELFARYAIAYDERRMDVLESVLAEDATYEAHLGNRTLAVFPDRAAALAGMQSVMQQQGDDQRRHNITNIVADLVSPTEVLATAYATVTLVQPEGLAIGASALYRAELVRAEQGWLFRRIVVGMDGYAGQAPER